MQQGHTALLVCGISRFKIGPHRGRRAGNKQKRERGKNKRGEGKENGDMMCVSKANKGRTVLVIVTLCSIHRPVNKRGDVSVVD